MTVILGAMDEEIATYLQRADTEERGEGMFRIHLGTWRERPVLIAKTGVGKVLSAMVTQRLIDSFPIERIIFTGIGGGIDPALHIGTVVIAEDCVQHDFDATAVGFERGRIPYTPYRFIRCDEGLVRTALTCEVAGTDVVPGRILTGDQFITAADSRDFRYLREELHGHLIDMEGTSVALVAAVHAIPCLVIRVVSDRADGKAPADFGAFLDRASGYSGRVVEHILDHLTIRSGS